MGTQRMKSKPEVGYLLRRIQTRRTFFRRRVKDLDIESLAAAATILFIAGYDATATAMQYAFHALALKQVRDCPHYL